MGPDPPLNMPLHPAVAGREFAPAPDPLPTAVVDAHTHLDACGADTPARVVAAAERARAVGVAAIVTVGDDLAACRAAVAAAHADPHVYAAVALHPTHARRLDDAARVEIDALATDRRVVAIGETGLDYHWEPVDRAAQAEALAWHIDLAKRVGKPLMIHDRDAHQDVLDILRAEGAPDTVIFHCFSGDEAMARTCVDAGYLLSFAGTVSFTNARELARAAAIAPTDAVLVETDAPFLTPHPFRGKRNESFMLPYTLRALAQIRCADVESLCSAVRSNTERAYQILVTEP